MSRRLEIELTSVRPDGSWTWRVSGAREPKGEMPASVVPSGAKVGDVLRADADFLIEGIEILHIVPPKAARKEPETLQLLGSGRSEPGVTTQLVERKGRERGDRRDRGERGERRGDRREGRRDSGERRPRGPRPDPVPERPKPKRLRPGRTHRTAVLDEVAPEMRPIAEQVLKGGVPAVREAVAEQNKKAKAENRPEAPVDQVVALAEAMLPALRAAEWRDRAEAALADLEELDLRDLRSVVVAADNVTRDEELKALRDQLQAGLNRRVEEEHVLWVADIEANLKAGRFVRALRLTSRPPKAGTPVPAELAEQLVAAVSGGLTPATNQELWAASVDALAYSPVRGQVVPNGIPDKPTDELLEAVRRVADRVPKVAALFGIDPAEAAAAKRRPRPNRPRTGAKKPSDQKPSDQKSSARSERPSRTAEPTEETSGSEPPAAAAAVAADAVTSEDPSTVEQPSVDDAAPADPSPTMDADASEAQQVATDSDTAVVDEAPADEAVADEPAADEAAPTEAAPTEAAADEAPANDAAPTEAAPATTATAPSTDTDHAVADSAPDESPTAEAMYVDDAVSDAVEG